MLFLSGMLLAVLMAGCGKSPQQAAFEQATAAEQHATAEQLSSIKASYEAVIRMDAASRWATQARTRLAAVDAKLHAHQKTQELNESVFHQTGVD
jgi:hypothetical protein